MLRVGLTGGIGAGKSEVSKRLAMLGAVVLDADKAAREVVEPGTPGLARIVESFGPGVLKEDGSLDRPKLGEVVFGDSEALARLNGIVHPLVHEHIRAAEDAAIAAGGADLVLVHDIPLLAEGGRSSGFDLVIVVDAPTELQVSRLVEQRGMTAEHAAARMAAQATREDRLAIASIVIDNSGTLDELDRRVAEVWAQLRSRAAGIPRLVAAASPSAGGFREALECHTPAVELIESSRWDPWNPRETFGGEREVTLCGRLLT